MENLTKENFWNELYEKHPVQMQVFCDWIDEYKKKNRWESLFARGNYITDGAVVLRTPKYHELPLSIQIGIFFEFGIEHDERREDVENVHRQLRSSIQHLFAKLEGNSKDEQR